MKFDKTINLNKDETLDILYESWRLDETGRVSSKDAAVLYKNEDPKKELKLSYFYQTHLLPQPWWGNIKDPKIIVLALNPSYDPIKDENDESIPGIFNALTENVIKGQNTMNWFNFKDAEATKWWIKTLGDLYNEKDIYAINKNVGFFNLCGYHRDSYKNILQKCLIKKNSLGNDLKDFIEMFDNVVQSFNDINVPFYNDKYLPTQNAMVLHINKLIRLPITRHVVLIWGYNEWKNAGVNFSSAGVIDKLLIVNKYNSSNRYITNTHKFYKENINNKLKIMDFINISASNLSTGLKKESMKEKYTEFYGNLKRVITEKSEV